MRAGHEEEGMMSVFLPTTPNPTSGFLLFVPRKDIEILSMSVEEAAKMVISAGLVTPKLREDAKVILDAEQADALRATYGATSRDEDKPRKRESA